MGAQIQASLCTGEGIVSLQVNFCDSEGLELRGVHEKHGAVTVTDCLGAALDAVEAKRRLARSLYVDVQAFYLGTRGPVVGGEGPGRDFCSAYNTRSDAVARRRLEAFADAAHPFQRHGEVLALLGVQPI